MSFSLDALGKADDDRRRATVPELRAPGHQRNTPTRSAFRILILMVLLLISFLLGFLSRPYVDSGYAIKIVRDVENTAALSKEGSDTLPLAHPSPAAHDEMQLPASLPIELSVISYSSVPTERFAMLNGFLMYEGDILSAGERLIEIKPDGVLLEKDGRQYKLGLAIAPRH